MGIIIAGLIFSVVLTFRDIDIVMVLITVCYSYGAIRLLTNSVGSIERNSWRVQIRLFLFCENLYVVKLFHEKISYIICRMHADEKEVV